MTISLGLDIGSNSVGSAWVDTEQKTICMAVSIFPAGVDEQENKRGAPKNQARRQTRSQRRMTDRRARRKRKLVSFLAAQGFLPSDPEERRKLLGVDPWQLRRKALTDALTPFEFGRVLVHLAQRRGAVGVVTDPDDPEEGQVKAGMDRLTALMKERGAETVGQLMADLMDQRRQLNNGVAVQEPIRNRQYRMPEERLLFAGRDLIQKEFHLIVERQRAKTDSPLAGRLTDELIGQLDNPQQTDQWRHQGLLFGQRRTYWDTGTLGRCALEPTERCAPIADRHASYFRVVETVNNIRIQ
jgi:CRISPR-associated endonuclease Csn1